LLPKSDSVAAPVVGELKREANVTAGASNVNLIFADVPAFVLTISSGVRPVPRPTLTIQDNDVVAIQLALLHQVSPRAADGEVFK